MRNNLKKIISGIIAGVLIMSAFLPYRLKAATVDELNSFIDGIIAYNINEEGCNSYEEWFEKLKDKVGDGSEWYVIGLSAAGKNVDPEGYSKALGAFAESKPPAGATARERLSLALVACGADDHEYVLKTVDDAPGTQGIMSLVFGLHLLNNHIPSDNHTAEELIGLILDERVSDGGWAVIGTHSDVDVTAMTLQALAPYYGENDEVRAAVDATLELLSQKQLASGGYSGFGSENPESVSQVIMALCALGIDPLSDERFIKDGKTTLDGLLAYKRADGSFSHITGGNANFSATYQAFLAFTALKGYYEGKGRIYIFDKNETEPEIPEEITVSPKPEPADAPEEVSPEEIKQETTETEKVPEVLTDIKNESAGGNSIKLILYAGVLLSGLICAGVLFATGHRNRKNYIFVGAVCLLLCVLVFFARISSGSGYYGKTSGEKANAVGKVTLTIRCDTITEFSDIKYIPEDGVVLPVTTYEIEDGDTVYDILVEAVRENNIQMENRGSATGTHGMVYIAGIGHIYEQQFGELSGWVYHVNGIAPSCGCGDYTLKDGDTVEWLYTRNLGRDLGEDFDWEQDR